MSELGVEFGEITLPPDNVLRAGSDVDPKALQFGGMAIILPDDSVWVNRVYKGRLAGIDTNMDWIYTTQIAPTANHTSTRVRWFRTMLEKEQA